MIQQSGCTALTGDKLRSPISGGNPSAVAKSVTLWSFSDAHPVSGHIEKGPRLVNNQSALKRDPAESRSRV